jgi:hypothetical protein
MITKFEDSKQDTFLEFRKSKNKTLLVEISDRQTAEGFSCRLNEDDLFSLIGQLLRIQSELKKEVNNV